MTSEQLLERALYSSASIHQPPTSLFSAFIRSDPQLMDVTLSD